MTKKGWKEDGAKVSDKSADLAFTAPEGPAKLTVKRRGDMSDAELTLTLKSKAAASPLAPKAGMVKLAAGQGYMGPDGPTLEVKPGDFTAAMKGDDPQTFTAGPDEIWMIGVGPGGLIAIKQ